MSQRKLRVGIVGVGNCASSFVQGLSYYGEAKANEPVPGLMNVELGGYHVGDIEIASAFDISAGKVGLDVARSDVRAAEQHAEILGRAADRRHGPARQDPRRARQVPARGDPGGGRARRRMSPRSCDRSRTDVLVSYLPVGSQQATEYYAEQALEAGCAFVNCIPVFIASDPKWRRRFETRRAAARRRRHQEPGRRDDRAPRAHEPVPRARGAARPHLPAQLRRQHRLPEHARAGAARVEEDLEDPGRDEPARHAARRATTCMSARAISCRG